jgi:rhamnosyltransferase
MSPRKVAIIGARGIANYGGFETLVSELAPRLRERGYEIMCSHRWVDQASRTLYFRGVTPLYFPFRFPKSTLFSRFFELLYDSYFLVMCSLWLKCDLVYCLGTGAGFALPISRLTRSKTIVNIDGLEWKREKFGRAQKSLIKWLFLTCYLFSDFILVDNSRLTDYVPARYRKKTVFISYGVTIPECPRIDSEVAEDYARSALSIPTDEDYWLVVARLEPDNNIHTIIRAYSESGTRKRLLVVGSFSSCQYEAQVREILKELPEGKNVVFSGSIFDQNHLTHVRCHAFAYLHGHSVGGTNPSLLEAMSVGRAVIAHDNVFNRDVCGRSALYFRDSSDLARQMDTLESNSEMPARLGSEAREIVVAGYGWEAVVDAYDRLFLGI